MGSTELLRHLAIGHWLFFCVLEVQAQGICVSPPLSQPKNKFVCPLVDGGTVRSSDACAAGGGAFDSARQGGKKHHALDINANAGAAVRAAKAGKVAVAALEWGPMGSTVIIDHEDGDYTIYGHLATITVKAGACVAAGATIGSVGYSGNASCLREKKLSAHLHIAIIRAASVGLANESKPIATAVKNSDDWLEFGREFFGTDNLDLGIKDPQGILTSLQACLR